MQLQILMVACELMLYNFKHNFAETHTKINYNDGRSNHTSSVNYFVWDNFIQQAVKF